jgi:hypothetical protein
MTSRPAELQRVGADRIWHARAFVLDDIDRLSTSCGRLRQEVEAVATSEVDPDRQRLVIQLHCGGADVVSAGELLGSWLAHDPRAEWDLSVLDRVSGPTGELVRRVRTHFFRGLGREP